MPTADEVLAALPADVQTELKAKQQVVKDAEPIFDLAATITSGGQVDFGAATAALAAGASLAAGPLAGAVILASGAAIQAFGAGLEAVFKAFGLYTPVKPEHKYKGLWRDDETRPSGPEDRPGQGQDSSHDLPGWLTFRDDNDWFFFMSYGPYANSNSSVWRGDEPKRGEMGGRLRISNPSLPGVQQLYELIFNKDPQMTVANDRNAFDEYFVTLMLPNLERAINGFGYVSPKQLLQAAANVWNQKHVPSGDDVTYTGPEKTFPKTVVEAILAPDWVENENQRQVPLHVNMGGAPPRVVNVRGLRISQTPLSKARVDLENALKAHGL